MPKLRLYTIFHLNLAYSSIEEEQRPEIVRRCYWPLLELATRLNVPIAVEASGYTLETINQIDSSWIAHLREAIQRGACEFIGSGYAQTIGPLVPAEVNAANLRLGNEVYERLLQVRPTIALANEQAYSAGLLQHYLNAGYQAIVMEWNNPASAHKEWRRQWRYFPQKAVGQGGEEITVIWNDSIAFQKFQRYAHKEMTLEQVLSFLDSQTGEGERCFPLYGNDAEIFDFRPGRYLTEAKLHERTEWHRVESLLMNLTRDDRFEIIPPSQTLALLDSPEAGHKLHLESAAQPTPVKKQPKYNLTRWAVTGKGDFEINTGCWQIYSTLRAGGQIEESVWRRLCHLWSSDYRTHITEPRWQKVLAELRAFQQELGLHGDQDRHACHGGSPGTDATPTLTPVHSGLGDASVRPEASRESPDETATTRSAPGQPPTEGRILPIETDRVRLHLNTR
ncbi:MAG: glycoside hydrolase family 57, partial [Anaerolineae bacterium]